MTGGDTFGAAGASTARASGSGAIERSLGRNIASPIAAAPRSAAPPAIATMVVVRGRSLFGLVDAPHSAVVNPLSFRGEDDAETPPESPARRTSGGAKFLGSDSGVASSVSASPLARSLSSFTVRAASLPNERGVPRNIPDIRITEGTAEGEAKGASASASSAID